MHDLFISYSRRDQGYARKLADDLRARGFGVWIDDRIEHGDHWFDEIEQAIAAAKAVLVIMTPDADKSEWVRKEILLAKRDNKTIFPLLLAGREFGMLIDIQYIDVRGGKLPPESFYPQLSWTVGVQGRKPPFDPLKALRGLSLSGGKRGAVVAVALVIAALCALATFAAIWSEFEPLFGGGGGQQSNAQNFTGGGNNGVGNAQSFLTLLGQGNVGGATAYVCPEAQSYLASTLTNAFVALGVSGISDVQCAASGSDHVTCAYWATTWSGSVQSQDTFVMQNGLVCGVVGA